MRSNDASYGEHLCHRGGIMTTALYDIEYSLHGEPRHFIVRAEQMDNAEAWHWASCDAGICPIPKIRHERIRKMSKPMAERYGLSDVNWRRCGVAKPV